MPAQSESSYGGSSVGSSNSSFRRRPKLGLDGDPNGEHDDLLHQQSSLEGGIFGVLFTLSKEKNERIIEYRWVLLKMLLDTWQLFITVIEPTHGWDIDEDGAAWRVIGVLNFRWLKDLPYGVYIGVLYTMVVALFINVVLCVWVAWSFKEQKFQYLWPITVLRVFSSVFFQAFDVTSLNLFQLGFSCGYSQNSSLFMRMQLFPQYKCTDMPQMLHAVVSGVTMAAFITIALLLNMAEVEVNPTSRRPAALGHSGAEVTGFAIKVLMTLVGVFISYRRVLAFLYLGLSLWLAYEYARWAPHLVEWVNYLKTGSAAVIVYCAAMQLLLVWAPGQSAASLPQYSQGITVGMVAGLVPAFFIGVLIARWYIRSYTAAALAAFKTVEPGCKPQDVFPFKSPRDVERVARSARVWTERYVLDKAAVTQAEEVIKAGLATFPGEAFMAVYYANFMIEVLGVSQSGSRQIEHARKLDPDMMCRFIIFVRHQQATQRAASSSVNANGQMDLMGYVEFQRKQRMVVHHHKEALLANCNFWRTLQSSHVSFTSLAKALGRIESSVSQAETAYRVVLEQYGTTPRLVRLYAKFLESIKNDPWGASEYYEKAEQLEANKDNDTSGLMLPDGTSLGRIEEQPSAIIITNAFGEIQMVSKGANHLFGYKKGDLEGKNVTVLMPQHLAQKHAAAMQRYVAAGSSAPVVFKRQAVALHKEGVAFSIKISVSRSSGIGEDSILVAVIEPLLEGRNVAMLWAVASGAVVCADSHFVASYGYEVGDVLGMRLHNILKPSAMYSTSGEDFLSSGMERRPSSATQRQSTIAAVAPAEEFVKRLLDGAAAAGAGAGVSEELDQSTSPALLAHRYDSPMACTVNIRAVAVGDTPLFEVRITQRSTAPHLFMVTSKRGVIRHMSGDLAAVLGMSKESGANANDLLGGPMAVDFGAGHLQNSADTATSMRLQQFLPAPWRDLHPRYMRDTGVYTPPSRAFSCRGPGGAPGPTLALADVKGRVVYMHTAVSTTDASGELLHMVRFQASSAEMGASERRLRLRIGSDGVIQSVMPGTPQSLFGLDHDGMKGNYLWEFVSLIVPWDHGHAEAAAPDPRAVPARSAAQLQRAASAVPAVAEADAAGGAKASASRDELVVLPPSREPTDDLTGVMTDLNFQKGKRLLDALVKRALLKPGCSWRVGVAPPGVAEEVASTTSDPEMAAALIAHRTKASVMQLEVSLGAPGEPPAIHVNLWLANSLSAVLEINSHGKISKVLEEQIRPAGLIFGVPPSSLINEPLARYLQLPPSISSVAMLLSEAAAKKSALKQAVKDKAVKAGPVHKLKGVHIDGAKLELSIQMVGVHCPGQPMTAVIHVVNPSLGNPRALEAQLLQGSHKRESMAHVMDFVPGLEMERPAGQMTKMPPMAGRKGGMSLAARTASSNALKAAIAVPGDFNALTPPQLPMAMAVAGASGGDVESDAARVPTPPVVQPIARPRGARMSTPVANVRAVGLDGPRATGNGMSDDSAEARSRLALTPRLALGGLAGPQALSIHSPRAKAQLSSEGVYTSGGAAPAGDIPLAALAALEGPKPRGTPRGPCPAPAAAADVAGSSEEDSSSRSFKGVALDMSMPARLSKSHPQDNAKLLRIGEWVVSKGEVYMGSRQTTQLGMGMEPEAGGSDEDVMSQPLAMDQVQQLRHLISATQEGGIDEDMAQSLMAAIAARHSGVGGAQQTGPAAVAHIRLSPGAPPAVAAGLRKPVSGGGIPLPEMKPAMTLGAFVGGGGGGADDSSDAGSEGAKSQGSQGSAMSGMSSMTGGTAAGGGHNADYKRGKRYRKLARLMDSPQAQQLLLRFRLHTILTLVALAALHTTCFALIMKFIEEKQTSLEGLTSSGHVGLYAAQIMLDTRTLDQIQKGKGGPLLYGAEDLPKYAKELSGAAAKLKYETNKVYTDYETQAVLDVYQYKLVPAWNGWYDNGTDIISQTSVWDLGTNLYIAARDVFQNHKVWSSAGVNISATRSGNYIMRNTETFYAGFRGVMDALLVEAVTDAEDVNILQLIFLVLEGCVACSIGAAYIVYLLKLVSNQRYTLYETFLGVPIGLTRALATQNTTLLDDESDEEEDNAEELFHKHADNAAPDAAQAAEAQKPVRRAGFSLSEGQPAPEKGSKVSRTNSRKSVDGQAAGGEEAYPRPTGWGPRALLHRLRCCLPLRRNAVAPEKAGAAAPQGKRKLKRNSNETTWIVLPFMVWSILIIIIYAVDYAKLSGAGAMVAVQSVSCYYNARIHRATALAQEACAAETTADFRSAQSRLLRYADALKYLHYTLVLGTEAYKVTGPKTEVFPMVTNPIAHADPDVEQEFFSNTGCFRTISAPCPGPSFRYYEVSRTGMDSIIQRFLYEMYELANYPGHLAKGGLNNTHLDFAWNVGITDAADGAERIVQSHLTIIKAMFKEMELLHIVLFVLMWAGALMFMVLQFNPLLKRIRKEKRRIAELMSQLPSELDVEKMVAAALGAQQQPGQMGAGDKGGQGADALGANGPGGVAGGAPDEDLGRTTSAMSEPQSSKQWRAILKATTTGARTNSGSVKGINA